MSREATEWLKGFLKKHPFMPPSEKRLMVFLCKKHTVKFGHAVVSYSDMSTSTMDSPRTCKRSIRRLTDAGFIGVIRQRNGARQGTNAYVILAMSGCHTQTPEGVSSGHPEKTRQGDTVTPPNARARALIGKGGVSSTGHKSNGLH